MMVLSAVGDTAVAGWEAMENYGTNLLVREPRPVTVAKRWVYTAINVRSVKVTGDNLRVWCLPGNPPSLSVTLPWSRLIPAKRTSKIYWSIGEGLFVIASNFLASCHVNIRKRPLEADSV